MAASARGSAEMSRERERTHDPRHGRTKDEGRVLTHGGAEPPSPRTLAVSKTVGRGRPTTSFTESVSK